MKKIFKILYLLIFLFVIQQGNSQLSKIHYIPPLATSTSSNNAPNEQWFHISTPSENDVNFTIKRGDGSAYYADTVSNANPWTARANPSNANNHFFTSKNPGDFGEYVFQNCSNLSSISMYSSTMDGFFPKLVGNNSYITYLPI